MRVPGSHSKPRQLTADSLSASPPASDIPPPPSVPPGLPKKVPSLLGRGHAGCLTPGPLGFWARSKGNEKVCYTAHGVHRIIHTTATCCRLHQSYSLLGTKRQQTLPPHLPRSLPLSLPLSSLLWEAQTMSTLRLNGRRENENYSFIL